MKAKVLSALLVLLFVLSLFTACGSDAKPQPSSDSDSGNDTTAATAATPAEENNSKISKDFRSGEILIDDNLIKLPVKLSELTALGWTLDSSAPAAIEAKADIRTGEWANIAKGIYLKKGSDSLDLSVYNWTDQDIRPEDGYVVWLSTDEDNSGSVVIPGDFEVGKALKNDIVAKWGEPDNERDINSDAYACTFDIDDYAAYELTFGKNDNVLLYVSITNGNKPSGAASVNKVFTIDQDTANSIKARDTFAVKVTNMQIADGYYDTDNIKLSGEDAIVFTVSNNSGKDIKAVELLVIGYKQNGELIKIKSPSYVSDFREDKYITVAKNVEELLVKNNESATIAAACDATEYAGAEAIVFSYTDADGQRVENPLASEWFNGIYER